MRGRVKGAESPGYKKPDARSRSVVYPAKMAAGSQTIGII